MVNTEDSLDNSLTTGQKVMVNLAYSCVNLS